MHIQVNLYYNSIGEYASLLIAALLLFVIFYTKPKWTYVFKYIFYGTVWSVVACALQISIMIVCNYPDRFFNRNIFLAQELLFLLAYNIILYHIFSYVNMMSIIRRTQRKEFFVMYAVLSVIYVVGIIYEIVSGQIYVVNADGIDIHHFVRYYCAAGIVCAIICLYASSSNRKDISRIIWTTVCMVVPMEIVILLLQIFLVTRFSVVFSGLSYVLVFMFAFILFHTEPYDELSGAQGIHALEEYVDRYIGKRDFYIVYVFFTFPTVTAMMDNAMEIGTRGLLACRSIESISRKLHMYKAAEDRYIDVLEKCDEREARNHINQIRGIFDSVKADLDVPFNYVMIAGEVKKELKSSAMSHEFFEYIAQRFTNLNSSHFYMIGPEDYNDFAEYYEISNTLKDIRNTQNFDDERIVVYAQPIYSVETGSFRVAEALMRLKVGDKLIYPDRFIPTAEQNGCVHALSCIILNKVCKAIQELETEYDFDAISINISSKELSHETMYQEFLDIIDKYDIDVSKIRMEITETAMFENSECADQNMRILNNAGIQLYLDDFGTGYSSLERVMDCPVKTIKFDKALLYKSLEDDRMADIMTYLIEVLKKNGFITLVEGVEDESQNRYSVERGFDFIQGYHYAKPGPIEKLGEYFSKK